MSDKTRRIKLSVEDDFSRALGQYVNMVAQAERETQSLGNSSTRSGGGVRQFAQDMFYMGNTAMMAYRSLSYGVQQLDALAQSANQMERSRIALEGVAGGAEEASKWLEAVARATKNTITEQEASSMAFQIMNLGLADTAEEAERFARTAAIIGAASPQIKDTGEAISQIALTLSNQSYMRLDQLGVSAGDVRTRVQELKSEIAGLTTEDAFNMAVMEELNRQAEAIGDSILEVGSNTEQLKAKWADFKTDIGFRIADGFEAASGAILALGRDYDAVSQSLMMPAGSTQAGFTPEERAAQIISEALTGMSPAMSRQEAMDRYSSLLPDMPYLMTGPEYEQWASQQLHLQQSQTQGFDYTLDMAGRPGMLNTLNTNIWRMLSESPLGGMVSTPQLDNRWRMPYQFDSNPDWIRRMQHMRQSSGPAGYTDMMNTIGQFRPDQMWAATGDEYAGAMFQEQRLEQSQQAARGLVNILQTGMDGVASKVDEFVTAIETMEPPASLAEKFGIDPDSFDVDVYDKARDALAKYNIEQETATELMTRYQLAVGMTNPEQLLFNEYLDSLSEMFATGEMPMDEYLDILEQISTMDYSGLTEGLQPLLDAGQSDVVLGFLERLGNIPVEGFQTAINPWEAMLGVSGGVDKEGNPVSIPADASGWNRDEDAAMSPFKMMLTDMDTFEGRLIEAESTWPGHIATWTNLATGEVTTWTDTSIEQIGTVEDEVIALQDTISKLKGIAFTIQVKTQAIGANVVPGDGEAGGVGGRSGASSYGGYQGIEFAPTVVNSTAQPVTVQLQLDSETIYEKTVAVGTNRSL